LTGLHERRAAEPSTDPDETHGGRRQHVLHLRPYRLAELRQLLPGVSGAVRTQQLPQIKQMD